MEFNFGDSKPLGKKPKLGGRRPKPRLRGKNKKGKAKARDGPPKPWQVKRKKTTSEAKKPELGKAKVSEEVLEVAGPNKKNPEGSEIRLKKKTMMEKGPSNGSIPEEEEDQNHLVEVAEDEGLSRKLISTKDADRLNAFQDVEKWSDAVVTKGFFMTNLHLYVKEQEEEILIHLLSIMKSIFYSPEAPQLAENLKFQLFLRNYCECLMNTSESRMAKDLSIEIIPLIFLAVQREKFLIQVANIFKRQTEKCQANLMLFLLEILKSGHLKELDYLKKIYPIINDKINDPSAKMVKATVLLLKEMYLWMGETMFDYLQLQNADKEAELKAYGAGLRKADMKIRNHHGHRVMRIEPYELETAQDLPKEVLTEKWCNEVYNEKNLEKQKEKLKHLRTLLEAIPRLEPKNNSPQAFLNLTSKIFLDGNMDLHLEIITIVGLFSKSLRAHFEPHSKFILSVFFKKLKDRNSKVIEAIFRALMNCFTFLTIHDTIDKFKDHLFDRSGDKKKNILSLLIKLVEKDLGFLADPDNEDSEVRNIVKMCVKLLEEGDSLVSNKACELIGKLRDKYPEAVDPIISDVNEHWLVVVNKFSVTVHEADAGGPSQEYPDPLDPQENNQHTKSKVDQIKELREELFSGKTVKLGDTAKFTGFLYKKLVFLNNLTDGFYEMDEVELKETYLLIEELVLKIEPEALTEDSRHLLVSFFFEQSNCHSSTELIRSMQFFIDSVLITPREFLLDTYDIIRGQDPEIHDEFIVNLIRLLETELIIDKNLKKIAHDEFIEFMESHYAIPESSARQRFRILGFMRVIEKKFGINHLENYPELLLNEYESEKHKLKRVLKKFLNRVDDRHNRKRRMAIEDLLKTHDAQTIKGYFSQLDFLKYLKRLLIQEMDEGVYSYLVEILEKYLVLYQRNKEEFSLKNYLYVFQIIINNYANKGEAGRFTHIDKLFHKTVKCLSPNVVFYELLEDPNNLSMREDILNFYVIYHTDILPDRRFMKWLSALVDDRVMYSKDLRKLVESVLLMLKATENDELLTMGAENKNIKDIWHRNEENILFNEGILFGESIFDSVSKFRMIKKFIMDTLGIDESKFYSKTIGRLFKRSSDMKKVKIVFYLIKSYENTNRIAENIFNDIQNVEWKRSDQMTQMILIKMLFNLLKNKVHEGHTDFFKRVRKMLTKVVKMNAERNDVFKEVFGFSECEEEYFKNLVYDNVDLGFSPFQNDQDFEQDEPYDEPEQPSQQNLNTYSTNNFANPQNVSNIYQSNAGNSYLKGQATYSNLQSDYQSIKKSNRKNGPNQAHQKSFVLDPADSQSTYKNIYNEYEYQSTKANQSTKYSRTSNNLRVRPRSKDKSAESIELLSHNLKLMVTFDFDQFQEGTEYIKGLLQRAKNQPPTHPVCRFIISHSNSIISTYVEVINGVMPQGINFQLGISHYMTIFSPFHSFLMIPQIFSQIEQQVVSEMITCVIVKLVNSNNEKDTFETLIKSNPSHEAEQNFKISEYVTRSLNSVTLKIIQNCEINFLLQGLFQILTITRASPDWPSRKETKTNSLAAKCINRSFKKIEGNIQRIDPQIAFACIISYTDFFVESSEDQHAWRAFRSLINELIKALPTEVIFDAYSSVVGQKNETIVSGWMRTSIQNLQKVDPVNISVNSPHNISGIHNQQSFVSNGADMVHQRIMELIQMVNRETRMSRTNKFLKEILILVENNRHINFEQYGKAFIKQKLFDKLCNSLYHNDNFSEVHSVISTNTRKTKMDSTYYHPRKLKDSKSIKSFNKSPQRTKRY